jgi:hypothetical protein
MPKIKREKNHWRNQWLGVLGGAGVGLALVPIFPDLANQIGVFYLVLWSAVIGGVLTSLNAFMRAGAALTRSQNNWLNLLVGLGVSILILAIFAALIRYLQP